MTVQKHLEQLLKTSAHYTLNSQDKKQIEQSGLEHFVFNKLKSKKFRKWKLSPALEQRVKTTLDLTITKGEKLEAVFFQGGYKLWRLPSTPEVDWAEFFNIAYLLQYLAPVAAAYKGEVQLTYYMHTLLMEAHDNLTTQEINAYINSFQKLIDAFSPYLPANLSIKIWKDADIYSRNEYFEVLEAGFKIAEKDFPQLPADKQENLLKLSRLNFKVAGAVDYSNASQKELDALILKGAIYETATKYLAKAQDQAKDPKRLLLFTVTNDLFIGVGTTSSSIVKHWTGFGILERKGEKIYERVVSPSQLEQIKDQEYQRIDINLIDLKNLKQIRVYDQRFNFVQGALAI